MSLQQVETILGRRKASNGYQYLVKWKYYPLDQSSWEVTKNLSEVKYLIKEYDKKNKSEGNKIQLVYDQLPGFRAPGSHTHHNMKNSGYLMNGLKQKTGGEFKKINKTIERQEDSHGNQPIKIIGMNQEKGNLWFYYQKFGIRGWTSRKYLLKNHPQKLCEFYLRSITPNQQIEQIDAGKFPKK